MYLIESFAVNCKSATVHRSRASPGLALQRTRLGCHYVLRVDWHRYTSFFPAAARCMHPKRVVLIHKSSNTYPKRLASRVNTPEGGKSIIQLLPVLTHHAALWKESVKLRVSPSPHRLLDNLIFFLPQQTLRIHPPALLHQPSYRARSLAALPNIQILTYPAQCHSQGVSKISVQIASREIDKANVGEAHW